MLLLARQYRLDIQIPPVSVQWRRYCDIGLPRDPSALSVACAIQQLDVVLVSHAFSDPRQQRLCH